MLDFMMVSTRTKKKDGPVEIYPKFIIRNPSQHLMIRGSDFYAVWVEEKGLWSTNEQDCLEIIDRELDRYAKENGSRYENGYRVLHMWDAESGMIDFWHRYCQKQMRDSFHMLDEKLIFSNMKTGMQDYASKKLPYPLEAGDYSAWDRMISVLYSENERKKIEWAIGSIVAGDSRKLQKFMVLYGAAGTGKSTILNVIQLLFEGYTSVFDAKALGSASNSFALEAFKTNPLVAIQHDGDLSKIEDNTRLNSLVSHELMTVNEKFKSTYANKFKSFLFMGTNRPVRITDAKSGLIRRLIDVSPTGEKLSPTEYKRLTKTVEFELGAIANHCLEVYLSDPGAYDDYIPINMLGASNDFYNFIVDSWFEFEKSDETTLKAAWTLYDSYCKNARVAIPYSQRAFKEELKNYFDEYYDRKTLPDGMRVRNYYKGFKKNIFDPEEKPKEEKKDEGWIKLEKQKSLFDEMMKDQPAQYPTPDNSRLSRKWINVTTKLSDISTSRLHHLKVPIWLICVDFDISVNGEKSLERNLEEANKWPPTYAEVSKSGKAIHLYYIYKGDPEKLSRIYSDEIEVKVFTGDSSLRRMLTLCNDIPVATLTGGLPLKEEKKTINTKNLLSEKSIRNQITKNLNKEYHAYTRPSVDFIHKILDDAYNSDISYDVSDMKNAVIAFAASSTHNSDYCLKRIDEMKFKSKDREEKAESPPETEPDSPIIFYDVEVFPNLFLINWKKQGKDAPVVRMINPSPVDIENLVRYRLVGFNCRRYDNHILYARMLGYSNIQLYQLSQRIVNGDRAAFFGEAYNLSYTDVYDFASAGNKMSLKKFEIKLGIHHQELGMPWDEPVPEEKWDLVAKYCDNDVIATEAVFDHLSADWTARKILADVAEMTVNDTTNSLTTRIIFDRIRKPQDEFQYRDLAQPVKELKDEVLKFLKDADPEMMSTLHGEEDSLLPYFPGYSFEKGVSTYREEIVGEGGYVYSEPGMYGNVALLDIASMHPHSVIAECLFGPRFTRRFKEIVDGRVSIKHQAWTEVNDILDGKLGPYIEKVKNGELTSKQLANALKTAINSVYGLTSAAFENAFRDPRNKDNIVAKRGALFMVNLKHEVQERGYTVAHIKTDSIKIPDADPDIIRFVMDYGKKYGYTFEHEATYDKMCLVNKAVYIAKYDTAESCMAKYGYIPGDNKDYSGEWTATGEQFAVPYVFKKLFTHEKVEFNDLCETFSVSTAIYLDMNESLPNVEEEEKLLAKIMKKNGLTGEDILYLRENKRFPKEDEMEDPIGLAMEIMDLEKSISMGHNYRFVGKVGQFTPVEPGCGGGLLRRKADWKYTDVTNSSGYRWMESEMVRTTNKEEMVDLRFYNRLVDDAKEAIEQYGDFEWFASSSRYDVPPEG